MKGNPTLDAKWHPNRHFADILGKVYEKFLEYIENQKMLPKLMDGSNLQRTTMEEESNSVTIHIDKENREYVRCISIALEENYSLSHTLCSRFIP